MKATGADRSKTIENDSRILSDSYKSLAEVTEGAKVFDDIQNFRIESENRALQSVLDYYHIKKDPFDGAGEQDREHIKKILLDMQIGMRKIRLTDEWYRNTVNPVIAYTGDKRAVALTPTVTGRFQFYRSGTGRMEKVTVANADEFGEEAYSFFRTFPERSMKLGDLFAFMRRCFTAGDIMLFLILSVVSVLLGMMVPAVTAYIFSQVIYLKPDYFNGMFPFVGALVLLITSAISTFLINIVKTQSLQRISQKIETGVRTAAMHRTLHLQVGFFREYSSGDLAARVQMIHLFCTAIAEGILSTGLMAVLSFSYIAQIGRIVPSMVPVTLGIVAAIVLYFALYMKREMEMITTKLGANTRENGLLFSILTGIQKIKTSGSEKRFFVKWMGTYKKAAMAEFRPGFIIRFSPAIFLTITLVGTFFIYVAAEHADIRTDQFMAFIAAYGLLTGSLNALHELIPQAAMIPSIARMIRPILEQEAEGRDSRVSVKELRGEITISDIRFRYSEKSPYILDGFSLHVNPGDYVAIVGKSGCGKSTIMRILLGFDEPESGAVFYDENDLSMLEKQSLRRNIGIVMQDSRLFAGSIYDNISLSSPGMSREAAWEAARMAGIEKDIREMPMEMNTMVDENASSVSGGQKQRIIIARALAGKPNLILFDEATSALDNITQKTVTDTLDSLDCTRVIIAHRLSTIRKCKRIVMLDEGRIVEDGTYEELLAAGGEFAKMVARQNMEQKSEKEII